MDLEKQKLEIKGALVHFYRNAIKDDYLQALENAVEEIQTIKNINYTRCCETLPTIIEIDFNGHLKCQIETTDKKPKILKAVNGYGHPVDCREGQIRINEV